MSSRHPTPTGARSRVKRGFGVVSDAIYGGNIPLAARSTATRAQLTTAWNVNAAYEHFWNPRWRTSLYGGYAAVSHNRRGNAIPLFNGGCRLYAQTADWPLLQPPAATTTGAPGGSVRAPSGTSPRTSIWASTSCTPTCSAQACRADNTTSRRTAIGGATHVSDVDNWQFRFRVHRDFYP